MELKKDTAKAGVEWEDSLALGLYDIDAQHRGLFASLEELLRLSARKSKEQVLRASLHRFRNHVVLHFEGEADLMREMGVLPKHSHLHLRAHEDFIEHVDRVIAVADLGEDFPLPPLVEMLARWLRLHIVSADRLMAQQVAALRTGASPAEIEALPAAMPLEDFYAHLSDRTIEMLEMNLQLQREIVRRKRAEKDFDLSRLWIRAMADLSHSWEYWVGPNGEILYISPACEEITGYSQRDFENEPGLLNGIIHPEDRHLMDMHLHYIGQGREDGNEVDFRIIRKDGGVRWVAHSCQPVVNKKGKYFGRRASRRDRTERYKEEESLRMAAAVLETVNEAVMVSDRQNIIIAANPSFATLTGYAPAEAVGRNFLEMMGGANLPLLLADARRTLIRTGTWQGELRLTRKDGSVFFSAASINSVRDEGGRVTSYVTIFSDISERKEKEERIYFLAHYDTLTGLPNRTLFTDRLRQTVLTARRYSARLALMFVDLDKFKPVNDTYGHEAGDALLQEIGARLKGVIRESDTAARIGGDEFVVLLPGADKVESVQAIAEKILQEVERPFSFNNQDIRISASIGYALYPEHGEDFSRLMRNADHAMYQAKHGSGPSIVCFSQP